MQKCTMDIGNFCQAISDDPHYDSGISHPCVVPDHQSFCIYYQPGKERDTEDSDRYRDDDEALILIGDEGEEIE